MNRVRYVDKRILCNYDLREEFFENLGLKIVDMIPLRKVFVLLTTEGKKILKITDLTEKRVEFIDRALKCIEAGCSNVLNYYKNSNGKIIIFWEGQKFILLEMIEGREATFTNPVEVELCAKSLANMHIASKGILYELSKEDIEENTSIDLFKKFNNELTLLDEIKEIVEKFKFKNEFDTIFLEVADVLRNDLLNSIEIIEKSQYKELLLNKHKKVLCHNDLAHHNFIIDNEEVSIIDFDYCNINDRVIDIYNYSVKVLKSVSYDINALDLIIKSYSSISELSKEEISILYALFYYPRDIINISIDYYLKQKSWDEEVFLSRFKNKLELEVYRKEMLSKL